MIYQCYPKKENEKSLFSEEPYEGFGLEPEVNESLFLNCPELEDPFNRLQLTEYACMLWHWRNPESNSDDWFGTTSHRQLDKLFYRFSTKEMVDKLVNDHNVVGWGEYSMYGGNKNSISLREHTNICHPGLNEYMEKVLEDFNCTLPARWDSQTTGFFCNYWAMNLDLFNEYMEFSWPIVKNSLNKIKDSNYFKTQTTYLTVSKDKAIGYLMERLFIIWYMRKGITPFNPFTSLPILHRA
tara:strand:+ start:296 stop:1015 length:720 start_codon:yes stop_codon:yes gene_type:complete